MGFDSPRELRASVSRGSNSPPDCYSLPLPFDPVSLGWAPMSYRGGITWWCLGGDDGVRTHDPLLAGQVLSQLSYTPIGLGFHSK